MEGKKDGTWEKVALRYRLPECKPPGMPGAVLSGAGGTGTLSVFFRYVVLKEEV